MPKRKKNQSSRNAKRFCPSHAWGISLLYSMYDPQFQVYIDGTIVIMKDKFPKAKYHYLVLPVEKITNLSQLTSKHIDLLGYMDFMAGKFTSEKHHGIEFRRGFHADASLVRLHMHVLSEDMSSQHLKTKFQWNSFTTEYFIHPKAVRDSLKKHGKFDVPSLETCKRYKNKPTACHLCGMKINNINKLKTHVATHIP